MNEMIKIIQKTLPPNTSLSERFIEAVLKRLVSFGYNLNGGADGCVLAFAIQKVESHIKNSCNVTDIPDGLFFNAVDRVCGEFLYSKKQTGQLELEGLDLSAAIASISEGDTSISFNTGTSDEERFNLLLSWLINSGEGDFVCYRKLKW